MINTCWMQVWFDAAVVTDNCNDSDVTVTYSPVPPGNVFPVGFHTITVTATDASGNSTSCQFNITVIDPQPPVINVCPIDITINNATDSCGAFASWIQPTVFDNCGYTLTNWVEYDPSAGMTDGPVFNNQNNYFPVGTSIVTYTALDATLASASCSFSVTVIDVQAPTFVTAPQDTTIYAVSDDCSAPYTWVEPFVTDNCEVDSVWFETIPVGYGNGDDFPVGQTTVVYTAIDIHGNSSTHTFIITVIDTTGPVFDNCPDDIVINSLDGECGAIATWEQVTATDNCQVATIVSSSNSGDYFPVGSTTVTITATDIYGNSSICEFTVTVIDAEPPVFESVPEQFFLCAVDTATFSIEDEIMGALIVTDNCGVLSVDYADFDWIVGDNMVIITATDVNGNTADTVVVVTVYPMPTIVLLSDSIDACSGETIILSVENPDPSYQYVWSQTFGGVIGVGPTYQFSPIRPHHEGEYTVTATNEYGCSVSANVVVEVNNCTIVIPEFFSPDGDGINDFFVIENLEAYPGTKVLIFNRWGSQVYESGDYLNNWDGTSDSRFNVGSNELPEGTYFYILTLGGYETEGTYGNVYKGYIYLKR